MKKSHLTLLLLIFLGWGGPGPAAHRVETAEGVRETQCSGTLRAIPATIVAAPDTGASLDAPVARESSSRLGRRLSRVRTGLRVARICLNVALDLLEKSLAGHAPASR